MSLNNERSHSEYASNIIPKELRSSSAFLGNDIAPVALPPTEDDYASPDFEEYSGSDDDFAFPSSEDKITPKLETENEV